MKTYSGESSTNSSPVSEWERTEITSPMRADDGWGHPTSPEYSGLRNEEIDQQLATAKHNAQSWMDCHDDGCFVH